MNIYREENKIQNVLMSCFPNAIWEIDGNNYNTLVWDEKNIELKPSLETINNLWNNVRYNGLRIIRNTKLSESDWTICNDTPLSHEKQEEWKIYRQALRDFPKNTTDPNNPVWPETPN